MAEYSEFGLSVNRALDQPPRRTKTWLCAQVAEDTKMYVDSARMSRILTGRDNSPRIVDSICKILNIEKTTT